MTTTPKRVRPLEVTVTTNRIVFLDDAGTVYVWDVDPETSELDIRMSGKGMESAIKLQAEHINGNSADDNWYVCVLADCAFPAFYLVRADSESDASDWFATECEALCKIDAKDLSDYGDDYTVNDNGTPVDLEALHCIRLCIDRVEGNGARA